MFTSSICSMLKLNCDRWTALRYILATIYLVKLDQKAKAPKAWSTCLRSVYILTVLEPTERNLFWNTFTMGRGSFSSVFQFSCVVVNGPPRKASGWSSWNWTSWNWTSFSTSVYFTCIPIPAQRLSETFMKTEVLWFSLTLASSTASVQFSLMSSSLAERDASRESFCSFIVLNPACHRFPVFLYAPSSKSLTVGDFLWISKVQLPTYQNQWRNRYS